MARPPKVDFSFFGSDALLRQNFFRGFFSKMFSVPQQLQSMVRPISIILLAFLFSPAAAYSLPLSRRALLQRSTVPLIGGIVTVTAPSFASAASSCMADCVKNCKMLAPNDTTSYCDDSCKEYCQDPERTDADEKASDSGEVGLKSLINGGKTVAVGEDHPPRFDLPGLNFISGKGRELIGGKQH